MGGCVCVCVRVGKAEPCPLVTAGRCAFCLPFDYSSSVGCLLPRLNNSSSREKAKAQWVESSSLIESTCALGTFIFCFDPNSHGTARHSTASSRSANGYRGDGSGSGSKRERERESLVVMRPYRRESSVGWCSIKTAHMMINGDCQKRAAISLSIDDKASRRKTSQTNKHANTQASKVRYGGCAQCSDNLPDRWAARVWAWCGRWGRRCCWQLVARSYCSWRASRRRGAWRPDCHRWPIGRPVPTSSIWTNRDWRWRTIADEPLLLLLLHQCSRRSGQCETAANQWRNTPSPTFHRVTCGLKKKKKKSK